MNLLRSILCSVVCLLVFSCSSSTNPDTSMQAITGATVYDGNGNRIKNAVILIQNDRIQQIGDSTLAIPEGARISDLKGKYITPGLVDAHVHFFQTAFFDARPDALNLRDTLPYEAVYDYQKENPQRYYEAYLRSGVTAVYDVGDFKWTLDLPETTENDSLAPHVASAGPLLTPVPAAYISGFNTQGDTVMINLDSPETGISHVKVNTARGATGIKIWSLAPQDSVFMESLKATAQAVQEEGNQLIVHATSLEEAKAALRLNAKLLVHSVEDTLVDQEFIDLAKSKQTFYNPTLIVSRGYHNTYMAILGEVFQLEDPYDVVDAKTKTMLEGAEKFQKFFGDTAKARERMNRTEIRLEKADRIMAANLKKIYEASIPIVVGTDAGNPGTLHGVSYYDELEAIQAAGIPAEAIIVMATKNGAQAMRRGDDLGTLENGKIADLIVLDKDPGETIENMRSITHFMRAGWLRSVDKPFGEK